MARMAIPSIGIGSNAKDQRAKSGVDPNQLPTIEVVTEATIKAKASPGIPVGKTLQIHG
jgi:hypothetical protein